MKLYRGYVDKPKIATPEAVEEYKRLAELRDEINNRLKNPADIVREMGITNFNRLNELKKIVGDQFFTDDEEMARGFAGERGYVIKMDVPDEIAQEHYSGVEMMARDGSPRPITNYKFTGKELWGIYNDQKWKIDLIELERENLGKEGNNPLVPPKDLKRR